MSNFQHVSFCAPSGMTWQSATTSFNHLISSPYSQNCMQAYTLIIYITWSSSDLHITLQKGAPSSCNPTPWLPWLGTSLREPLTEQTELCYRFPHSLCAACLIFHAWGQGEREGGCRWPSACASSQSTAWSRPDTVGPPGCQGAADSYPPCHWPAPSGPFPQHFSPASPSPIWAPPRRRIQHLPSLNFIGLIIAHFSHLSRSLCNLSRSLHKYVVPHNKHVALIIGNLDKI